MLKDLGGPELLIIVVIIAVLFGSKRMPDAARGLGRSLRIFKDETKGITTPLGNPDSAMRSDSQLD